ncbi:MAG: hypothetical protein ABEK84_03945 [Salinibacter sp.]
MKRFVLHPVVSGVLLIVVLVGGRREVRAQTPVSCDTSYAQARKAYFAAKFEEALKLLRPCANEATLSDSARARMYRLLSFVHLGRNDQQAARLAVETLLDLRPSYTPKPNRDRPDFVALVQKVKESRRVAAKKTEQKNRRWVRWALGSAAAVLGTAAVLLFGGGGSGEGKDPLPRPEPPPE